MNANQDRAWAAVRQAPALGMSTLGTRSDPWSEWARAVLTMSVGDYAGAFDILEPLTKCDSAEVAGLACARIAAGLRQIDEHPLAVAWDDKAMAAAGQAVLDGIVGRAADQVGVGDAAGAAGFLAGAPARCRTMRDDIRVAWVACEISLLKGQYRIAAAHGERAHKVSAAMGSPRHLVKSMLFWAAADRAAVPTGSEAVAFALLHRGYNRARALSLRPVLWPLVAVLGDEASPEQLRVAGQAVTYLCDHLPAGLGADWANRPDIVDLRNRA